jgi:CheY-like chemotaxis protein
MSMTARILVVEDDPALLQNIAQYFQHEGYEVTGVQEGTKALSLLQELWDLVITDLMLPDMDGIELLQAVKRVRPETAVIVITGFGSIDSAVTAMKNGAADYITKPFRLAQLREVVERTVARLEKERTSLPVSPSPAPRPEAAKEPVTRSLWRRDDFKTPSSFRDEFLWLPARALVLFTGLAEARLWQVAVQLVSLRLQEGDGVVYATAEEPPERLRHRLTEFVPLRALEEGVVTLVDLSSRWVRIEGEAAQIHVATLEDVSRILLTALNRHLLSFDRVVLMIDPLSTLCRLLDEREAFQFVHLLRGISRESDVAVFCLVYKESLSTPIRTGVEGLADVVIQLEHDPIRDVIRYEVTKGAPGDRPRVNELRGEAQFLVPVKPVSRKYGYARCARCGEEFFIAFFTPASGEGQFVCERCAR